MEDRKMQQLPKIKRYHRPKRYSWEQPTHDELRAGLTPIISKGAFSLVWVNPNPNPVELHPEEDDWDPQEGIED
jgi:hypothetical protein